jgi:flagellar basal-body rod modification protein FlgD
MDIPNVTYLSNQAQTASTPKKVLDKDDFLKLLVTKMSHQDPLNPEDDQAFVAELAQFSSLEQLKNMNDNLSQDMKWNAMLSQTINNTSATSLIGRTVDADSSELFVGSSGSADIAYHLTGDASKVTVDIKDSTGKVVNSFTSNSLSAGDHSLHWDGTDSAGKAVTAGVYTISITAKDADGKAVTTTQSLEGTVTGVSYENGSALLNVGGLQIPLSSVRQVREG